MIKEKTLDDAFYESLKDLYYAEKQSVKASTKAAKASSMPELKEAFLQHKEESIIQVERIENVFEMIDKAARAVTCEAMKGLITEMNDDLEDFGGSMAADAVIIGCAQALEHYEIARYGMLKTWAQQLGHRDAVDLFKASLDEEKKADQLLTKLSSKVNAMAE